MADEVPPGQYRQTTDPCEILLKALREMLTVRQLYHEIHCPGGGEPCWDERTNIIAYLAHALGIGKENKLGDVRRKLEEYDRTCKCPTWGHVARDN